MFFAVFSEKRSQESILNGQKGVGLKPLLYCREIPSEHKEIRVIVFFHDPVHDFDEPQEMIDVKPGMVDECIQGHFFPFRLDMETEVFLNEGGQFMGFYQGSTM
jgi:hypothetical protein